MLGGLESIERLRFLKQSRWFLVSSVRRFFPGNTIPFQIVEEFWGSSIANFHRFQSAKEYLVSQIVEEAQRESVPLSEIERKMLFSSENYWSLPDIMEVNAQFEKEYDSEEYEAKISELIRNAYDRAKKESQSETERWKEAIRILRKEDHYLLVMIDEALGKFGIWGRNFQNIFQWIGTIAFIVIYFLYREWMHPTDWQMPWRDALVMIGILSILDLGPLAGHWQDYRLDVQRSREQGQAE